MGVLRGSRREGKDLEDEFDLFISQKADFGL